MENSNNQNTNQKDEALKRDFRTGQYIYAGIYLLLIVCLIVFFS
ncbi:hypothetical protein N9U59_03490 [Gammaproteobacteria bacterium]|nr:hypothetical protein [Gammaproteobacteria bacterium]